MSQVLLCDIRQRDVYALRPGDSHCGCNGGEPSLMIIRSDPDEVGLLAVGNVNPLHSSFSLSLSLSLSLTLSLTPSLYLSFARPLTPTSRQWVRIKSDISLHTLIILSLSLSLSLSVSLSLCLFFHALTSRLARSHA